MFPADTADFYKVFLRVKQIIHPLRIATLHKKTRKKYVYYDTFAAKVLIPNFFDTCHLMMGSIVEKKVSILRYPSENPHHELYIYKLVMYLFQLLDVEFFRILSHLPRFLVISILDFFFFFWCFWSLFQ